MFRARRLILVLPVAMAGALLAVVVGMSTVDAGDSARQPSTSPNVGEPLRSSSAEQKAVAEHLLRVGAKFYGAWWCPACFKQKNLFGKEAGNRLPYVECDKSDQGREACRAVSIRAYPTWVLGSKRIEGVQTLEELKLWSGFGGATTSGLPQAPVR